MSIKVMSEVWEIDGIDSSECLVLIALADHADDFGRCYPSISRLAKRTKLSDRGVQKVISRLIDKGFVTVSVGCGQGGSNLYTVTSTPEPRSPLNDVHPRTPFTTPPNHVRKTPEPRSPKPSGTVIEPSEEPPLSPMDEKRVRRRSVALPPDWSPSDRNLEDARRRNFTEQEIHHEADRFRDYHLAKGTTFRDWDAGWRTWLGNARRFGKPGSSGGQQPASGQQFTGIAGAAMRSRASRQQGF